MSRRTATWTTAEHRVAGCRGQWVVQIGQPFTFDDFVSAVEARAYCEACDALHTFRPFTQATDDPIDDEPVPERHRPLLSHSSWNSARASIPELHVLRVAGLELRGHDLFDGTPLSWDAFVDGERVGGVSRYLTQRYATRWAWGIGERYRVTASRDGYTSERAAARGLAAALAGADA